MTKPKALKFEVQSRTAGKDQSLSHYRLIKKAVRSKMHTHVDIKKQLYPLSCSVL